MYTITLVITIICVQQISSQLSRYECPPPWLSYEDSCYKFMLFLETYETARQTCAIDGASLVSVGSRGEHDFVSSWIIKNDKRSSEWYTSGARATQDPNKWRWDGDGTMLEGDQFWINDEFRKRPGELLLYGWDGSVLGWIVGASSNEAQDEEIKRAFICEIGKEQVFQILREDRGYDYGAEESFDNLLTGPKFITQPQDVIYDTQGTEKYATMRCVADSNPNPKYEWYITKEQNRTLIRPIVFRRYTITNGRLTIHNPQDVTDNGDYQCVSSNVFGAIVSNTVQLRFGYLLDFPNSKRDAVRVQAYYGVGIECNEPNHGYSSLSFRWYKDTIRNFIRPELKPYSFVSANGKLYFSSVTKDDNGYYHCVVSSPYNPSSLASSSMGKISKEIQLIVADAVASIHEPQIASGFPTVFPSSPKQGDEVSLECFAMGTDELYYSWERIGASMPRKARLTDHNRVLRIPKAELRDRGTYKCTVKRENGLSTTGTVQVPIEAVPFFIIPLKNQHMDHNADLTWRCIAEGIPTVKYSWYRNATRLDLSKLLSADRARYEINQNVLTIKKVDPNRDSGMYQCAAENSHGRRFSSAQLRVLSFQPSFRKHPLPSRQYGTLRGNTTIVCRPEAAPMAEKTWLKNGRPMDPSSDPQAKLHMLPNGNLVIKEITKSDEGNYTCVASNLNGEARSTTRLSVLATTTLSSPPEDEIVIQGQTGFIRCEASFNPLLDITYDWYQNHYKIEFIRVKTLGQDQIYIERDEHFRRGGGINRGGLFIVNAQYEHSGRYRCEAKTTTETMSSQALLTVVGPPSQPSGCYGEAVTNDSIILNWGEAGRNGEDIVTYIIEMLNVDEEGESWEDVNLKMTQDILVRRRSKVTGLNPWSRYRFRVKAENKYGISKPSDPSTTYTTLEDKPTAAPQWVGGGEGKVGELNMQWDPVPKKHQNGAGFGYIIKWKRKNMLDEEWDEHILLGPDHNRYVALVGSDNYYTQYDIQVQGFNSIGKGPSSETVTIYSAEDIPMDMPKNVRASQFNSTALYVEWIPVTNNRANIKGVLKGYRVNYWKRDSEEEEMSIYNYIPGQTDGGLIVGLDYNTMYTVNVQVVNSAGNGPKSEDFDQKTLRAPPLYAPTEVKVDKLGYDSIKVQWRGVSTSVDEEPLEGYMVRIWRVGENLYVAQDTDAARSSYIDIHGLDVNTMYNLRVFGYSRGGQGLMSSPGKQFILAPGCFVKKDSPDKDYINKCLGQTDSGVYHKVAPLAVIFSLISLLFTMWLH